MKLSLASRGLVDAPTRDIFHAPTPAAEGVIHISATSVTTHREGVRAAWKFTSRDLRARCMSTPASQTDRV